MNSSPLADLPTPPLPSPPRRPRQPGASLPPRPVIALALLLAVASAACGSAIPSAPATSTPVRAPTPSGVVSSPVSAPSASALPTSTSTPSPLPTPTAPPIGRNSDPFGYAAKGLRAEVLAFVPYGQLAYARDQLDYGVASTIAFFALQADGNGHLIRRGPAWQAWMSPAMDAVIARAHASGTRVVLALERFSWAAAETAVSARLLASSARRATLAHELTSEVVRRGVDGVNVDFEPVPVGMAAALTSFVRVLRADLDHAGVGYQLTVAILGHFESYDIRGLVAPHAADALYLMGYQYSGVWSDVAGSTDPYGGAPYDVLATLRVLRRWARPDQLIVGVPFYGHAWPTMTGALHAPTIGPGYDLPYADAAAVASQGGVRLDARQHSAWTAWQEEDCPSCAPTWWELYFDDATTLAYRWRVIVRAGYLGTGIWTVGDQGASGDLDRALRSVMLSAPSPSPSPSPSVASASPGPAYIESASPSQGLAPIGEGPAAVGAWTILRRDDDALEAVRLACRHRCPHSTRPFRYAQAPPPTFGILCATCQREKSYLSTPSARVSPGDRSSAGRSRPTPPPGTRRSGVGRSSPHGELTCPGARLGPAGAQDAERRGEPPCRPHPGSSVWGSLLVLQAVCSSVSV